MEGIYLSLYQKENFDTNLDGLGKLVKEKPNGSHKIAIKNISLLKKQSEAYAPPGVPHFACFRSSCV